MLSDFNLLFFKYKKTIAAEHAAINNAIIIIITAVINFYFVFIFYFPDNFSVSSLAFFKVTKDIANVINHAIKTGKTIYTEKSHENK